MPWGNMFFLYHYARNEFLGIRWRTVLYWQSAPKQVIPSWCSSRYVAPFTSLDILYGASSDSEKDSKYCSLLSNISRCRCCKIKIKTGHDNNTIFEQLMCWTMGIRKDADDESCQWRSALRSTIWWLVYLMQNYSAMPIAPYYTNRYLK